MGLRTPEQYKESLRDGRAVFFRGEKVADVTTHPVIGIAVEHACIDYRMAEDPKYRELAVMQDGGGEYSRYFHLPRNGDDLLKRSELIAASTREGATLVVLIKEIGTDALLRAAYDRRADGGRGQARVSRADRASIIAIAATTISRSRWRRPTSRAIARSDPPQQDHPDYYVRMVEERPDGIVVRGAKVHTSRLDQHQRGDRAADARDERRGQGLRGRLCAADQHAGAEAHREPARRAAQEHEFEHPISARHKMMETLTVFDDVFVPKERVFLQRRDRFRGTAGADLRALPSLHRGVVQAAAARTDGGGGLSRSPRPTASRARRTCATS